MSKKLIIILSVCFALVIAAIFVISPSISQSSQTLASRSEQLQSSVGRASKISATLTITDSDVVVYKYQRVSVKKGDSYDVEIAESKLGSDFSLSESTSSETVESVACPVTLSEDNVFGYVLDGNKLSCTVTKEQLSSVLSTSYVPAGAVSVVCEFSGKDATLVTCTFVTASGRNVGYVFAFEY